MRMSTDVPAEPRHFEEDGPTAMFSKHAPQSLFIRVCLLVQALDGLRGHGGVGLVVRDGYDEDMTTPWDEDFAFFCL